MNTRRQACTVLFFLALPVAAQQGAAVFHHFHRYPTGQYTTKLEGKTSGLPPSAPTTETTCTAPPNPAQLAAAIHVANTAAATQDCNIRILHDEEKLAEDEQTCKRGSSVQTIHSTMAALDDKTFIIDTVSKLGTVEMSAHSVVHYDGPCSAAQLAEASRATPPKPNPEECAELAASKKEMANNAKSCDDVPAEYRATCLKRLQGGSAIVDQMLAACAK
ncbi:hypothetical protein [Terriglobus sp.]|uniref:hypothetical protein n=1 Tax=Terriglobus sp. TaxID=1889013 RepID=UPI003AFFDAFD